MTKKELMGTYTAEQLAGMVINLQSTSEVKNDEIHELKWQISSLEEDNGRLQCKLDTYNGYLLPRATKEAKDMIDRNCFEEVMIVTSEEWRNKNRDEKQNSNFLETIEKIEEYTDARAEDLAACSADILEGEVRGLRYALERIKGFGFDVGKLEDLKEENKKKQEEIERLKKCMDANQYNIKDFERRIDEFCVEKERLESEVEKYRKAFEGSKKERDYQIGKYQKKLNELTEENEKLKGNVGSKGYFDKQNKTNNFYGMYACSAKNLKKDDLLMFLGILTKELISNGIDFRYEMENEFKVWDIEIKNDKVISDFLPTEPIKVADMLINAEGEYEHNPLVKKICGNDKGTYRIFDILELRQIAEHLLVYCNHNGEVEE